MKRMLPTLATSVFVLLIMASINTFAANRVTLSIKNQQAANDEYTAELWAETSDSDDWIVVSSNIAVNYNTLALTGLSLDPAFDINQELTDNFVSVTQTIGAGFIRLNLLKFPGSFTINSGTEFRIATLKWDIVDGDLKDDLSFITAGTNTSVFNSATELDFDTGDNTGYGIVNPTSRTIDGLNIDTQPKDQNACPGDDAEFSLSATGASLTYCWECNDGGGWVGVTGATSSVLELSDVFLGMDGNMYRCIVKSASDTLTSNEVDLTILEEPSFTSHPQNRTVCVNENTSFTIALDGSPTLTINWEVSDDGGETWEDVPGVTTTKFNLNSIGLDLDGNQYRAVVSNDCGSVTSEVANLTVLNTASITTHPQSQTGTIGGDVTFSVEAEGEGLTYQWQYEETDIPGANGTSLELELLRPSDAGDFRVVVTNECGAVNSETAELTLVEAPELMLTAYLRGYWDGTSHKPAGIMIDLYEGADLSTATRAGRFTALLNSDGDAELKLSGITTGDYWLVIRHGGHLAVVSAERVTLTNGSLSTHDFTVAANVLGGLVALDELLINGTPYNVVRTGDMNGDLSVGADDFIQLLLPYFGASNPGMAPPID